MAAGQQLRRPPFVDTVTEIMRRRSFLQYSHRSLLLDGGGGVLFAICAVLEEEFTLSSAAAGGWVWPWVGGLGSNSNSNPKSLSLLVSPPEEEDSAEVLLDEMFEMLGGLIQRASLLVSGDSQVEKSAGFDDPVNSNEKLSLLKVAAMIENSAKSGAETIDLGSGGED
ncbi:unnamed protein product [Linum tenue]|uniref:Uncharacterized protein n=1 Tax=Linum tenue TaxID=586396 RepID=A0AAV0GM86_9ROSI|nr:unnamed protein product [Linum tenue]